MNKLQFIKHHLLALLYFVGLFFFKLATVVLMVVGMFIVIPLAIPFSWQAISLNKGSDRTILRLPRWALWWDNAYDGMLGDERGWWDANADTEVLFGLFPLVRKYINIPILNAESYLSKWWWLSCRNPINYFGRNVIGVDATKVTMTYLYGDFSIRDNIGDNGYYLALYKDERGIPYYVLELCFDKGNFYGYYIQLGLKLRPYSVFDEDDPKRLKSLTFEININKDLR